MKVTDLLLDKIKDLHDQIVALEKIRDGILDYEEMNYTMNIHDYSLIPDHLMVSMMDYVERGYTLGGFLTAIFANDFMKVVGSADEGNLKILPVYASWVHNKAPMGCHGSYEIVKEWIEKKRKQAKEQTND